MADNSVVQTIKDAEADARSLSEFLTKSASFMVTRRLAPKVHTLNYYLNNFDLAAAKGDAVVNRADAVISDAQDRANNAINQITADGTAQIAIAISNAGFIPVGTFADGATLSNPNEVLKASDDKLYRWAGSLPKNVPASSTPESTGGFGSNAWLEVSDASLAQKLAGLGGASTIGSGVSVFNNMAEFLAAESQIQDGSKVFLASLYQGLDLEGEGRLYTYSKSNPKAIKQTTASGFLSRDFDGKVFVAEFGATGGAVADYSSREVDTDALRECFKVIRDNDGGTVSMGKGCIYHLRGIIEAECSNLYWEINGSTIVLGLVWIKWHPKTLGYGSHKNVHIKNGVWLGNTYIDTNPATGNSGGGSLQCDMGKIDGVWVTGNTYIESTVGGHTCDLLGSRFVHFENNTILGSANSNRPFAEIVQLGLCNAGGAGISINTSDSQYFDGKPTTDVYVRHNIYKPYINKTTGIKSYPTRPIGNHSYASGVKNIYFEDNYVEDIIKQTGDSLTSETMNMLGHNLHFNRNTIISSNGNDVVLRMQGSNYAAESEGVRPRFEIKDNSIIVKNAVKGVSSVAIAIPFKYSSSGTVEGVDYSLGKLGYDFEFSGNNITTDYTGYEGDFWGALYVDTDVDNAGISIKNNSFDTRGNPEFAVSFNQGQRSTRRDGKAEICRNVFRGTVRTGMIITKSESSGAGYGVGVAYTLDGNTFYNTPRAMHIGGNALVHICNNKAYDWPIYNSQGDVVLSLFYVAEGYPVITNNNVAVVPDDASYVGDVIGLPRDNVIGIGTKMNSIKDDILDGFKITKTTRMELQI